MKANELMIGDWVYSASMTPRKVQYLDGAKSDSIGVADHLNFESRINPIPLTAEILEKNGWFYNDLPMYQDWEKDGLFIQEDDSIHRSICIGINNSISVQYVHQLQHVLRLCGLDELADNLKI